MSDDDIWVHVEALKQQSLAVYRGRMSRRELEAWRTGELRGGALTLRQTYWIEEDPSGRVLLTVVGREGRFRSGNGVTHLAAHTVVNIMELRGADPGVEMEAEVLRLPFREPPPSGADG